MPAFVQAGTGVTMNGATGTITLSGATVGNIVIAQIIEDGWDGGGIDFSLGTISNIEALDGTDSAVTQIAGPELGSSWAVGSPTAAAQLLYIGRALTSAPSFGMASSGFDCYARLYEFSGVSLGTTLADVIENATAGTAVNGVGTSNTVADTSVQTLGADRLALQFVAVNDDNALDGFASETGGDWVEAVAEYLDSLGTDGCIQLQTATMASAGTINGGSDAMAASDSWGVVGFALKPQAAAPSLVAARRPERGLVLR